MENYRLDVRNIIGLVLVDILYIINSDLGSNELVSTHKIMLTAITS